MKYYTSFSKFLNLGIVQMVITACMIAVLLAIIFEPNIYWAKVLSLYAFYIMFLFLAAGFFFMVMNVRRLMYYALFACGTLSLFLKNASNENIVLPTENIENETIRLGLFNVSNFSNDLANDLDIIRSSKVDIVFFQEVTPEWAKYLEEELSTHYGHHHFYPRIDPFGQAVFSNLPFIKIDTFQFKSEPLFEEVPVLGVHFYDPVFGRIQCLSIHSLPPTGSQGYEKLGDLLSEAGQALLDDQSIQFVFSYLNVPAWNAEVKNFRYVYNLLDSRRVSKLFKMPLEHIFYSVEVECIEFVEQQCSSHYIGLVGAYQKVTKENENQMD